MLSDLPAKIKAGNAIICVLGLGRVGLPLGIVLARSGLRVIGVDVDEQKVLMINRGKIPFYYPIMEDWLGEVQAKGLFSVTTSSKRSIEESDVIIVTVGTPTGNQYQLDYSQLYQAMEEVVQANIKGKALIIRSTAVPKTISNIVLPLIKTKTKFRVGVDFALAACPERILEGQSHIELYELPEIIGGTDELSGMIAREVFLKINPGKRILRTTPTGAELAKLFTNIYRYVNFALANELAIWSERYGEDAHEVIKIANEGYQRSNISRPGFAGGPCLGKDGLLLDNGTTFSSIISVAWKLNEAIPQHVVMSLMDELGSLYGKKIAVLGLTFKADSDDLRLSPSFKLVETLKGYGAETLVHDPHIRNTLGLGDVLNRPEVVILATNHSAFEDLAHVIDNCGCKIVYDVWGVFKPKDFRIARYRRFGKAR